MSLEDFRRQYTLGGLTRAELPSKPTELFAEWLENALEQNPAEWFEPYTMTLATSSPSGDVSARIVLLRGHDNDGFVFFSNYESTKGQQMKANPRAALVFYWGYLERQVTIRGTVRTTDRDRSERYFHKRPRGSQISAAISRQSETIESRVWLEQKAMEYEAQLGDSVVPIPENWGGYLLAPTEIEFWQGRQNRLHDRIVYTRHEDATWTMTRRSP